jgi:ubiquitin carboxyl-terminal hydrolase 10
MYKQAGPSNFQKTFGNEGRAPSQYGSGRGRGRNAQMNNTYRHPHQQQAYYPTSPYAGPAMPMNGSMHDPYGHRQNGIVSGQHAGPSYHVPTSPALHPMHNYNPHAPPYLPPGALPSATPIYYPPPPPQMHHYPPPYHAPLHQITYSYYNYQSPKSPLPSQSVMQTHSPLQHPQPQPIQPAEQEDEIQHPPSELPSVNPETVSAPQNVSQVSVLPTPPDSDDPPDNPPPPDTPEPPPPSLPDADTIEESSPTPSHSRTVSASSTKIVLPSFFDDPMPRQEWAISRYRPDNPSDALGIIISLKAKPPVNIVNEAEEYTPPPRIRTPSTTKPVTRIRNTNTAKSVFTHPSLSESVIVQAGPKDVEVGIGQPNGEPTSSSATESDSRASTAPDTFTAGSPVSTATSISLAFAPKTEVELNGSAVQELAPEVASKSPSEGAPLTIASSTVKKSWASLLRTGEFPQASSLPTSSVVGFSIPGSVSTPSMTLGNSSEGKQGDFLNLLTHGPTGSINAPQIRPRGLVNTGNMCFANAVLQTLVYTPPFFRLFNEIGKYLGREGTKLSDLVGKEVPLMDATVEFLNEFKPKPRLSGNNNRDADDDFDGVDSFIPSNIYEAMKAKSRFENMGVSFQFRTFT